MFSTNLKRPLLALAVTAELLAVAGPAGLKAGSNDVLMETMLSPPEVDDEVLASINYEPDYIEGSQLRGLSVDEAHDLGMIVG